MHADVQLFLFFRLLIEKIFLGGKTVRKNYHTDNKSFMIYKDWEEYLETITDEETGKLFKALFAYSKRAEEAPFDGALRMLFTMMRNTIDRDGKKWEDVCEARSEGRRSSEKSKAAKVTKVTKDTKDHDKETEKDTETDTVTETEPRREGRSACGGSRSARKNSNKNEHSYDLDKLIEHALNTTPKLKKPDMDSS